MKKNLPYLSILCSSFLLSSLANAQTDHFAYAVTDVVKEGANWSFLRKIDLNTGSYSDVLLNGADVKQPAYDHATKKQFSEPQQDPRFGKVANAAFATGVAAIAYDKRNQRIYYTPMFINQLRYIDLKTMNVYFVSSPDIESLKIKAADQSNIITRMVIADDEKGYALTNDGNHLLQFTTGKKITITDLGVVVDDPANKTVSIHNSCSSFGGDMIADNEGNLLLFSNMRNVFKINIETKVATHLGSVSGLPATFTVNGTAVDNHNQVLVTSAVDNNNAFAVDSKTWTATPVKVNSGWRTADLANSNILATRKSAPYVRLLSNPNQVEDGRIQLYPNPVVNDQFNIQFNLNDGKYTIQIKDVTGRQVAQTVTSIIGKGQTKLITLPAGSSKGFYLVKVIDQNNKTVYSKKVLVAEQ
jgi:hypothetical protein